MVGRGWTQPGGRPHAEAMALDAAGKASLGATLYVTLEPCAHQSERGPACADLVATAGLARVVVGMADSDPRTTGSGCSSIEQSGKEVITAGWSADRLGLSGHVAHTRLGRPHITLKLALSLDGCIATAAGESQLDYWRGGARSYSPRTRAG